MKYAKKNKRSTCSVQLQTHAIFLGFCVVFFLCLSSFCVLFSMLPVSTLDYSLFIVPSSFSNVFAYTRIAIVFFFQIKYLTFVLLFLNHFTIYQYYINTNLLEIGYFCISTVCYICIHFILILVAKCYISNAKVIFHFLWTYSDSALFFSSIYSFYRYIISINAISQTQRLFFLSFFKEIISNDVYIASYHTNYICFKCPTE